MYDFMDIKGPMMFKLGRPNWLVPDAEWETFCVEARKLITRADGTIKDGYLASIYEAARGERCKIYLDREDKLLTPEDFYAAKIAYISSLIEMEGKFKEAEATRRGT